jgi:hypothetical protein
MNMDVPDTFPLNQYGQLVSRKKYANTTVRNYETRLSATTDLTIEEVTSAANKRYALLKEEEIQRTVVAVANFVRPPAATAATDGQPIMTEVQQGWLFTQVINLLHFDRLTNPRRHPFAVTEIIRALEESQSGNPTEVATAIIAQADARYDAGQATAPEANAQASDIITEDPPQAAATLVTEDDAGMEDKICEALQVAFINNITAWRDEEQAAQGAHPQRTQEQPRQAHPDNDNPQLSKADNQERARLRHERNTRAQNAPAHFIATCTCVECRTEVAM